MPVHNRRSLVNGIRTQKTVNGTVTNYNYHGSALISQVTGNDTLLFSYDASGNVVAVNYNGTYYYYVRNGQGDVVRLIDGENNTVVEYAYDSWGTPLSTTGTLASTLGAQNPFRYRGYVYDAETCWYYLQSRYYDSKTCRLLSSDVLLSTGRGVLGHNAYAYCGNSPANRRDMSGCCWEYIWDWIRSLFSDQGLENNNVIIIEEIAQINLAVVSETPAPPAPLPPVIEAYVSRAKSMIGDSYDRRDCAQLVRAAVLEYDAGFNRGARYQWSGFDDSLWKQVLEQDISKIPSGALLYYQTDEHRIVHTAIYLGCGKMIDSTDRQGIYGVSERPVDSGLTFAGKPISIVGYLYPKRLF